MRYRIEDMEVLHETEKAVLLKVPETRRTKFWYPRKLVSLELAEGCGDILLVELWGKKGTTILLSEGRRKSWQVKLEEYFKDYCVDAWED